MNLEIPNLKGKELFEFLIKNEKSLIAQKKFELKKGDAFHFGNSIETDKGKTVKANTPLSEDKNTIDVVSVINTTYWFDSHSDVHIDGIWKKSISEAKDFYLFVRNSCEALTPQCREDHRRLTRWRSTWTVNRRASRRGQMWLRSPL